LAAGGPGRRPGLWQRAARAGDRSSARAGRYPDAGRYADAYLDRDYARAQFRPAIRLRSSRHRRAAGGPAVRSGPESLAAVRDHDSQGLGEQGSGGHELSTGDDRPAQ